MRSLTRVVALCAALVCAGCGGRATSTGTSGSAKAAPDGSTATAIPVPKVDMPARSETMPLAQSSNAFGVELWRALPPDASNLAVSPASISVALAMTWGGAGSETEQEMRKVLRLEGDRDGWLTRWGQVSLALQNPSRALKLRMANRLFGEKSYGFEQAFIDMTGQRFAAPLERIDFASAPEPSRQHINGWVLGQTEQRIKDLLPPGCIGRDTKIVLVNALYFLADWLDPFSKEATREQAFHMSAAVTKNVPMMHKTAGLRTARADGVAVLEIPYQGDDAAMLIVLPDQLDGLAAVEQGLSLAKLESWRAALTPETVTVSLPKFEVNPPESMKLATVLQAMGIKTAFDQEKADFFGIAKPADPRNRLYISQVFHKAFVKVDEKGTEAAAATAVVMGPGGAAPQRGVEITADHPFLFFIVDKPSGLILFMGRVVDPSVRS